MRKRLCAILYGVWRRWGQIQTIMSLQPVAHWLQQRYFLFPVAHFPNDINNFRQKLKLLLSTLWRHTGGAEVSLHSFLIRAPNGGGLLALCSSRFTSGKEPRHTFQKKTQVQAANKVGLLLYRYFPNYVSVTSVALSAHKSVWCNYSSLSSPSRSAFYLFHTRIYFRGGKVNETWK